MRNIWLLLKNYFVCAIGNLRRKNSRTKTIIGISMVVILYAAFFTLIQMFMLFMAKTASQPVPGVETGAGIYSVLSMGFIMSVFMALIFAIQKITGGQKANDTELLLSMPFKKIEIITAKALSNFAFNLAFVILFFLPSIIAYLAYTPFNLVATIGCFAVLILIPFIAVGLSSMIDFLVTICFSNSKLGNISKALFTIFTLFGVIAVYEFFSFNLENPAVMKNVVGWMLNFDLLIMVPLIILAISIFALGCWLNSLLLNRESRSAQFKVTNISRKVTTPLKSLLKNETNRYFNSPALMINTLLGPLGIIALTIWIAIDKGNTVLELVTAFGFSPSTVYLIYGLIFAGLAILTYPSAVSISIEGKQLWILRSIPIPARTVITAKALFNIILLVPLTLTAGIVLMFALKISLLDFILMISIPILMAILVSYSGVLINIFFPKFEYENENTLIKQSTSATIMLFVGLLFILALSGLTIWLLFNLPVIYITLIIICALTTITGIVITLTYTIGQRIFNHL